MKSIRCFLSCWIVLQLLILFPVYSRAETTENLTDTERKKDTQIQEYSVDTEIGRVTVNTQEAVVGQTIRIMIDQNELKDQKKDASNPKKEPTEEKIDVNNSKNELSNQKLFGWLRLEKADQQYEQERQLSFSYDDKIKKWTADYIVTPYDVEGNWKLNVLMKNDETLIEKQVDLVHITNKEPLPDKEGPKMEELFVLGHAEGKFELKKGESLTVHAKLKDVESAVKQAIVQMEGKEKKITFSLQYEKKEDLWLGKYEITDALPPGIYKLRIEVVDAVGNKNVIESKYVVSVEQEKKEQETTDVQKEEKKDEKKPEKPSAKEVIITVIEPTKQKQKISVDQVAEVTVKTKSEILQEQKIAEQNKDNTEEKKEETKQKSSINSSDLFAIISGGFLLFLILKSNKEWGS